MFTNYGENNYCDVAPNWFERVQGCTYDCSGEQNRYVMSKITDQCITKDLLLLGGLTEKKNQGFLDKILNLLGFGEDEPTTQKVTKIENKTPLPALKTTTPKIIAAVVAEDPVPRITKKVEPKTKTENSPIIDKTPVKEVLPVKEKDIPPVKTPIVPSTIKKEPQKLPITVNKTPLIITKTPILNTKGRLYKK
jgi:hypothetical protein